MAKDWDFCADKKQAIKLLDDFYERGIKIENIAGESYLVYLNNDDFIFDDGTCINTRNRQRKYVIFEEVPITSFDSLYHITATDKDSKVEKIKTKLLKSKKLHKK